MLAQRLGLSINSSRPLGKWSPDDETSLEAWYQNAVGITLNGSDVSQWDDSSTNSHDMIQGTAAEQPAYSGGVLTFDGTDDNLASTQISLAGEFTVGISGDFTGVNNRTIIGDDDAVTEFIKLKSTSILTVRVAPGNVDFTLSSGTFGDGYLVITRDGSDNINAYYNGVSISAAQNRPNTVKIDNIGYSRSAGYYTGTIREVQIYSSTSADLTSNVNSRLSSL